VIRLIAFIVMDLVTLKTAAKWELLFNKRASKVGLLNILMGLQEHNKV
jgi:hypothetical protein